MLLRNPSLYYGNGRRRRVGRVVRRKRGGGFMDALKSAHNWIKSNKIISTVGNALGKIGVPYAGAIGTAAGTLGYGRRRRVVRRKRVVRRHGGAINIRGLLSKVHGFVKNNQLVSKGLSHFNHPKLAGLASSAGYGRRRSRRVVRRRRGGSLRSILGRVHSFVKSNQLVSKGLNHFGHSKLAGLASSAGYGKRRRTVRKRVVRRRAPVRRHRGGANGNYFSMSQLAVPEFT